MMSRLIYRNSGPNSADHLERRSIYSVTLPTYSPLGGALSRLRNCLATFIRPDGHLWRRMPRVSIVSFHLAAATNCPSRCLYSAILRGVPSHFFLLTSFRARDFNANSWVDTIVALPGFSDPGSAVFVQHTLLRFSFLSFCFLAFLFVQNSQDDLRKRKG